MRHEQYLYTLSDGRMCIEHFVNGWGTQLHKRPGEHMTNPYTQESATIARAVRLTGLQYREIISTNPNILQNRPDGLYRGWVR